MLDIARRDRVLSAKTAIAASAVLLIATVLSGCALAPMRPDGAGSTITPRTNATREGLHVAQATCSSPTEARDWAPYRYEQIDSSSWNIIPTWPPAIPEGVDVRSLAGPYQLTLVREANSGEDIITRGSLELIATTSDHHDIGELRNVIPLIGWASIDLATLGRIGLAHPLDQRDPGRPGVQASYWSETRRLSFSVGNSLELRHGALASRTFDAGVSFYVFRADSTILVGRWSEGSPTSSPPRGYFCAARTGLAPH